MDHIANGNPEFGRGSTETAARHAPQDSVEATVAGKLRGSPYAALRHLTCVYRDGVVTLQGRVPNFYTAQIAVATVRALIDGEIEIDNRISVNRHNGKHQAGTDKPA